MTNLANRSYVTKINLAKNLPLNTEFIAPVIILLVANMADLLKCFCREPKQKLSVLPDPKDSLSKKVPSSSIDQTKYS